MMNNVAHRRRTSLPFDATCELAVAGRRSKATMLKMPQLDYI
jgi:hypothetical protein